MPKAQKTAFASSGKINKSEWIRSKPTSLSAADLVSQARAERIKITPAFVYAVRTAAKAKNTKTAATRGGHRQAPAGAHLRDELALKRIVLNVGFARTEAILADLRKQVGL